MIRLIKRQDCQAIAQMEASCFNDAWDEKAYAKEWEKTYAKGWMIDGIGYIWTWFLYENAEIVRVGVLPEARNQGYAKKLVAYAMQAAKQADCMQMILEVRVSNAPAIAAYQECGLEISHCSKQHYADGQDAYVMIGKL